MTTRAIVIRDINSGRQIAARQISGDAGSVQRRQLAERLASQYSTKEDCYAVEHAVTSDGQLGAVLDKYELAL